MLRRFVSLTATAVVLASPLTAQTLTEDQAKKELFSSKTTEIGVSSALSASDQATLRALLPVMKERLATPVGYFGALAFSPTEGVVSESLQGALNYHTLAAAEAAALAACEAAKASGSARCKIGARILPKGYAPKDFTLSQQATEDFEKGYSRARGPRAFAASSTTGAWGWDTSGAAAVQACAADGVADCRVVIEDQ